MAIVNISVSNVLQPVVVERPKGGITAKGKFIILPLAPKQGIIASAYKPGNIVLVPYKRDLGIVASTKVVDFYALTFLNVSADIRKDGLSEYENVISPTPPVQITQNSFIRFKVKIAGEGNSQIVGEFQVVQNNTVLTRFRIEGLRAVIYFTGHWPLSNAKDLDYSISVIKAVFRPVTFDFSRVNIELFEEETLRIEAKGEVKAEEAEFFINHFNSTPYILVLFPVFIPYKADANQIVISKNDFFLKRAKLVTNKSGYIVKVSSVEKNPNDDKTLIVKLESGFEGDNTVYPLFPFLVKQVNAEAKGYYTSLSLILEAYPVKPTI